ncbi:MAG: hypothetical protein N3E40_02925, partial [Dehalococcoidia bacterium]|nr:hypothetical protein [Dehalococcoidia bacterium]
MFGPAQPYLLASLYRHLQVPVLVVTPDLETARALRDQLQIWCPPKTPLRLFPELEPGADDWLPDETTWERLRTLASLTLPSEDVVAPIVVTCARVATGPVVSREAFSAACIRLKTGGPADPVALIEAIHKNGYEVGPTVETPGTASRRGGIIDVYSPHAELPVRIEFTGNLVESIRTFDPRTQRSVAHLEGISIVPAREPPENMTGTIIDYLPENGILVLQNPEAIEHALEKPSYERLVSRAKQGGTLELLPWADRAITMPFLPVPSFNGKIDEFINTLKSLPRDGVRTVIVSHHARRLSEYFQESGIVVAPLSELSRLPEPGSLVLLEGSVNEGWAIDGSLRLFSDREIFGFVKQRRQVTKRPIHWQRLLTQFRPGDYVVHIEHGIGRFTGLVKQSQEGTEREYLVLEYAQGDRLYVPVDRIARVSRYVGTSDEPPALNRLGTQEWARTRSKVRKAVEDIAHDLIQLYAAREATPGHAFSPDTIWQQEMEAAFPYVETPDQIEAVRAVKEDMEKPRAMDR